jgi:hypothetical protein
MSKHSYCGKYEYMLIFILRESAMGMFTSLGLKRPAPPRAAAQGRFSIGGVTVINPMHGRRGGATISIADGAISDVAEGSSDAKSSEPWRISPAASPCPA